MKHTSGIRKLVPASVKRRLAPYLRPTPATSSPKPTPQELNADMTCVGTGAYFDPTVWIEFAQGLSVGNNVTVGSNTHIDAQGGVILCDGVSIAEHVTIVSALPLPESARDPDMPEEGFWSEVFIGRNVRIGAGACILPGATIGEGATIAAGALVCTDVPAGSDFGFAHAGTGIDTAGMFTRSDAALLKPTDPSSSATRSGREKLPNICFVASTGRSGSTTIADLLNKHPEIVARHEPRHQLIKLSADYAHGLLTREQVKARLERLFLDGSVYHEDRIHVESDLKYFNLFPILNDIFPDARFIWLVRSGYDVVTSTHSRSWFADSSHPVWFVINWFFHKNRVRGDLTGATPVDEWASMTPFQKNCWYWSYVNETIEKDLGAISASRQMFLRLEDLNNRIPELLEFLGLERTGLEVETTNEAFYPKAGPDTWSQDQKLDFERLCGPLMKRLY